MALVKDRHILDSLSLPGEINHNPPYLPHFPEGEEVQEFSYKRILIGSPEIFMTARKCLFLSVASRQPFQMQTTNTPTDKIEIPSPHTVKRPLVVKDTYLLCPAPVLEKEGT